MSGDDHEAEDALRDDVHDGVSDNLERNGERSEPLGKQPNDRVERPDDDGKPRNLAIKLDNLGVLAGDNSLTESAGERIDHGKEHGHSEQEPEPLNSGDHRDSAHVTSNHHQHVSADNSHNGDKILTGNESEVEDNEGSGHKPIEIADIEKLSAARNCCPPLTGKHSEIRESRNRTNEGVGEIIFSALSICVGSLGNHHNGGDSKSKKAQSQRADTGGSNLLDRGACRGGQCLCSGG
mmetsp:Transcript_40925/g.109477  ORF Transcript_40925/g.109477 Transcript_40925/m.109477 type:complete len:237 (+) Transcript_40925:417-1127(+)